MKNIFKRMLELSVIVSGETNTYKMKLFNELNEFLYSGDFTSYKNKAQFLKVATMSDSVIAKTMKQSEGAIRKTRMRLTEEFYKCVDMHYLEIIEFGTDVEAKTALREFQFIKMGVKAKDLFLDDLLTLINDAQYEDDVFEVGDCKYELTLLNWLTTEKIKSLMTNVDITRLGYLLKVIDGKAGTAKDRANVLRVILSEDLLSHVKKEDVDKFTFPPVRPDDTY